MSLGKKRDYLYLYLLLDLQYLYSRPWQEAIIINQIHLLVPVGEGHHDVQRGQAEVEVEKGIAVGDCFLLIVHRPAYAVLSYHALFNCPSALSCLHQLVHLGVTG